GFGEENGSHYFLSVRGRSSGRSEPCPHQDRQQQNVFHISDYYRRRTLQRHAPWRERMDSL
ncbi:MAG: hypothetical protein K0Q55_821, partial [Verrucomicrobia bacterium]|nr:hypothetical protein [Verrucomicrobiota bacterium]